LKKIKSPLSNRRERRIEREDPWEGRCRQGIQKIQAGGIDVEGRGLGWARTKERMEEEKKKLQKKRRERIHLFFLSFRVAGSMKASQFSFHSLSLLCVMCLEKKRRVA